jgi:undecaprenol kinase
MNGPLTNRLRSVEWELGAPDRRQFPRPFRARSRWQAVQCAWGGLHEAWGTQPNLRLHVMAGAAAVGLGLWARLSCVEWLWVSFAIGLVIFAELMNTAIEQTVDLVVGLRPDPLARRVKDVAAGCVLVAAAIAAIIGLLTFSPYLR